jgi:hypothetical protein
MNSKDALMAASSIVTQLKLVPIHPAFIEAIVLLDKDETTPVDETVTADNMDPGVATP